MKKVLDKITYKTLFLMVSMILAIPSIMYLIKNGTIVNFTEWFTFFLCKPKNYGETILGTIIFGIILILLFLYYLKIIKNSNKEFLNIKRVIMYILIISIIFAIVLPFTTSDIFYYIGTGWIDGNYNENPYYTSVHEVRMLNENDEILQRTGYWEKQVVVYGPLWAFICKILSSFSFGNATVALYVYKMVAVLVHIFNAILVYKITKNKKFVILYGLNPFILFEMITNVHNDIYLVLFILLALYFLLKRQNIWLTIVFMALATCIKYVAVLLIPFLVLYYLKNEKIHKKILKCILYAVIFIGVMLLIYLIYAEDVKILLVAIMQQQKFRESILTIILTISQKLQNGQIYTYSSYIFKTIFILVLIEGLIFMFLHKKINFKNTIKKYNNLLITFLFLIITNLCPWYMMWPIPTIFWLRGKEIKNILYLQFSYELVTLINFALWSESYKIGLFYLPIMVALIIIFNALDYIIKLNRIAKSKTSIEAL